MNSSCRLLISLTFVALGARHAWCDQLSDAKGALKSKDYGRAVGLLRPLAERGDPYAQCELAYLFEEGLGVAKDLGAAERWYRKSADQGYAEAQYDLGRNYEHEEFGRSMDYEEREKEALRWYGKAAKQGYAAAKDAMGRFLAPLRARHPFGIACADLGRSTTDFLLCAKISKKTIKFENPALSRIENYAETNAKTAAELPKGGKVEYTFCDSKLVIVDYGVHNADEDRFQEFLDKFTAAYGKPDKLEDKTERDDLLVDEEEEGPLMHSRYASWSDENTRRKLVLQFNTDAGNRKGLLSLGLSVPF